MGEGFVEACERELEHSRQIYNAALAERISGQTVGVDYGISSFAPLSNGKEIEQSAPSQNAPDKLQRQQRRLSHRQKGSKRRAKQRKRKTEKIIAELTDDQGAQKKK